MNRGQGIEGDLVYIEGDLEEEKREWLLHLIRRVEHSGNFQATPVRWDRRGSS